MRNNNLEFILILIGLIKHINQLLTVRQVSNILCFTSLERKVIGCLSYDNIKRLDNRELAQHIQDIFHKGLKIKHELIIKNKQISNSILDTLFRSGTEQTYNNLGHRIMHNKNIKINQRI
ncbi:MAG: hypothetical protein P857_1015 [Candidatus Xenolissoclinum pacificiensis L6]|uniref:Uncharacterized protein n=1 Tax=Candidatus Xenolissoclinum pacificiensis L6 TaxID=1401685 RepID=W2V2F6_9RICK|nr:MAG: hypothetical protein P857_1015 [Candidatus Xenolissoclinum pacificiensis L6]